MSPGVCYVSTDDAGSLVSVFLVCSFGIHHNPGGFTGFLGVHVVQ